jgi:hypothetical protein
VDLSPYDVITAVAVRQWALFSTKQAIKAGLTKGSLQWESGPAGRYERLLRSVYRLRDYPAPPLQLLGAALLAHGPGAVACAKSAGWALGLDGIEEGCIEVAVLPSRSHRRSDTRRRILRPTDIVPLGPFFMTDPLTTLLDLASDLDDTRWEWSRVSSPYGPFHHSTSDD